MEAASQHFFSRGFKPTALDKFYLNGSGPLEGPEPVAKELMLKSNHYLNVK